MNKEGQSEKLIRNFVEALLLPKEDDELPDYTGECVEDLGDGLFKIQTGNFTMIVNQAGIDLFDRAMKEQTEKNND